MGTYTLTDHFFLVDIPETNVILGVQWLISLQMEWVDINSGKTQTIKGMQTYPSHTTST